MSGKRSNSGFTLMEVLIATAILGIIMVTIYGSFVQTRRVIGRTESAVEGLRGVRAAFSRITSDIGMAFLSAANDNTFFVGTDDYEASYPSDQIEFTSFSHIRRSSDARESDQMEVGYFLRKDYEGASVLMKREKNRIDPNPTFGGRTYELCEEIAGLDFRYLDEGVWFESWDSRVTKKLPEAVEITLITKDGNGIEKSFRTIMEIPLSGISAQK
ncbi:MAG: prepilin-type N-terminal cleavage/methylation domain-containing protein [Nitrospirae bacterium]|nr:prepilin-type N-terminal cleavage/methylation domain-containing protein [Nitrospirota bacterium]